MANHGPARRHRFVATWRWFLLLALIIAVFAMRAPARAQDMVTVASVQTTAMGPVQMEAVSKLDATPRSESEPSPRKVSVTSGFGKRRDPINKRKRLHKGVDISRPAGTEVFAWLEGVVAHKGWMGRYGLTVDILHENGLVSRYAHLKEAAVVSGQPIEAGQLVGLIGRTGRTTGPNLHFEVLVGNKRSDPRKLSIDFSQIVGELVAKSRHRPRPEDILRPEMPFAADQTDQLQNQQEEGDLLSAPTTWPPRQEEATYVESPIRLEEGTR